MSEEEFDQEIFDCFVEETASVFGEIRDMLEKSKSGSLNDEEIDTLVRGYHSTRSLARAVSMRNLEQIAKLTEFRLMPAREDPGILDEANMQLAEEAYQELCRLREIAVNDQKNADFNADLAARLELPEQ